MSEEREFDQLIEIKTIKTDEWQWPKYWKEIIRNILPLAWPPSLPPRSRSDSLTILTLSCLKMVLPNWNILEQLTQWTKDFVAFRYISDLAG